MATWEQLKANLQSQKNELDTRTTDKLINQKVTNMNAAVSRYVNKAGISQNPDSDADYTTANTIFNELSTLEKNYAVLNTRLSAALRQVTNASDVQNKLQTVGTLRNDILNLEKELKHVKQDADTSLARQGTVTKPNQEVSMYQGISGTLGFVKPIRTISVPILLALGILLLFLSGLMLRDFFSPSSGLNTFGSEADSVFSLFTDSRFYSVMAGVVLVSTVLGILSYKGVLGHTLK